MSQFVLILALALAIVAAVLAVVMGKNWALAALSASIAFLEASYLGA